MSNNSSIVPETVFDTPAPTIHRSAHTAAIKITVTVTKVVEKISSKKAAAITPNPTKKNPAKKKPLISTKDNTWQTKGKKPTNSTTEDIKQSILSTKIALLHTKKKILTKALSSVGAEKKQLQGEIKK
eukprot:12929852-Ditylum_brightwellii.AAC.1